MASNNNDHATNKRRNDEPERPRLTKKQRRESARMKKNATQDTTEMQIKRTITNDAVVTEKVAEASSKKIEPEPLDPYLDALIDGNVLSPYRSDDGDPIEEVTVGFPHSRDRYGSSSSDEDF